MGYEQKSGVQLLGYLGAGRVVPWALEHSPGDSDVREKQSSALFKWLYFGVFSLQQLSGILGPYTIWDNNAFIVSGPELLLAARGLLYAFSPWKLAGTGAGFWFLWVMDYDCEERVLFGVLLSLPSSLTYHRGNFLLLFPAQGEDASPSPPQAAQITPESMASCQVSKPCPVLTPSLGAEFPACLALAGPCSDKKI